MKTEELIRLGSKYQTPLYVFDCDSLKARVDVIREKLGPDISLCYAMKANPFLTGEMAVLTDRIEVCSPGEMKICIREGICPQKILLSGVQKAKEDVLEALEYGVRTFTAESVLQMQLLDEVSREQKVHICVYPRLTAGSQFGMDFSDLAEIIHVRDKYEFCEIRGIHYFAGTQRKSPRHQDKDFRKIQEALKTLKEKENYEPEELEYGPGLYFPYFEGEEEDDLSSVDELREILEQNGGGVKITVEMGRYFAAECGYYLTSVCDAKTNDGSRYLILDGGIHHLNYFGGMMGLKVPHFMHLPWNGTTWGEPACCRADLQEYCLCGSLCTTADVIVRAALLKDPAPGDLLIFRNTGAYSVTESNALFLSRNLPKVVMAKKGRSWMEREDFGTYGLNH